MKRLSFILDIGFYLSMLSLAVGFISGYIGIDYYDFSRVGILILLILPLVFVFALALFFMYKKELVKSIVAVILLCVLIGNLFL